MVVGIVLKSSRVWISGNEWNTLKKCAFANKNGYTRSKGWMDFSIKNTLNRDPKKQIWNQTSHNQPQLWPGLKTISIQPPKNWQYTTLDRATWVWRTKISTQVDPRSCWDIFSMIWSSWLFWGQSYRAIATSMTSSEFLSILQGTLWWLNMVLENSHV